MDKDIKDGNCLIPVLLGVFVTVVSLMSESLPMSILSGLGSMIILGLVLNYKSS